jgi:hypothetical protein
MKHMLLKRQCAKTFGKRQATNETPPFPFFFLTAAVFTRGSAGTALRYPYPRLLRQFLYFCTSKAGRLSPSLSSGCLQARIGWYSSTLLLADNFFIFFIFIYFFEQRLSSGEDRLVQLNDIPDELQQRMRAFKGCFSF